MSNVDILSVGRDRRAEWLRRWEDASAATRTRVQVAVFLAVVVAAYHYSLQSLLQNLTLDTPLAYVGLVPVIALGLAAVRSRPGAGEPAIYDRQVDYIVGVPLIGTALALNLMLPAHLSAMFWVWRIDLLSMPFFVAGVTCLIFGTRTAWRQRLAIAYLLLAWPVPYTVVLLHLLSSFTNVTLAALRPLVQVVHVASPVPGGDGSIFTVSHAGRPFPLSVVSACSGVNGMVGFLLVGTAFGALVRGPRTRKALWLAFGMFLLWAINVGRLLFIFWAGKQYGEHMAIQVLHPFIGLITFNLGVLLMLLLLGPAGLRLGAPPATHDDTSTSRSRTLAVPRMYSAVALVAVVGAVLAVNNTGLKAYDLVANASGEPKLSSYLNYPASPPGWQRARFAYEFTFAKPFFGESSKWYRWYYQNDPSGHSDLYSSIPIVADVVNTNDLSSFSAYGVEACYRFHGYSLRDIAQVNLGGGITGQALSYSDTKHQDWSIVYWIWPVKDGSATHYERVILYMQNTAQATLTAPSNVPGIRSIKGALVGRDATERLLVNNRSFLVTFAREVITSQAKVPAGAVLSHRLPRRKQSTIGQQDVADTGLAGTGTATQPGTSRPPARSAGGAATTIVPASSAVVGKP